jgi:SAM-dependent methyltransferase
MGVALPTMLMFLMEHRASPFSGTLLQIGRQDIYFDFAMLERCATHLGVKLANPGKVVLKPNTWMPDVQTIDDITFFKALGFEHVQSIDASDYEQPDFVWDFNRPAPDSLKNRFDVIFDGGSLEHIFEVGTAFRNISSMLKVGGRAIHHAPTHNFVDHGFFSLSPTLFYDYYEANHFTDLKCHLVGARLPFQHNDVPKIYDYKPGMLEPVSVGGFTKEKFDGCEMFTTHFSGRKSSKSIGDVIPMQRRYREWWDNAKSQAG